MSLLVSLSLFALVGASVHRVDVGNGGLVYNPNNTVAAAGDTVEFYYYPKNHSVVQGSFDSPCMSSQGFYSGYIPSTAGEASSIFSVTINDTSPIYYYCSQPALGGHCAHGMVGCINCPTNGNTLAAYAVGAMNTTNATVTHPASINGGLIITNSNSTSGMNATMNITTTATMTGASVTAGGSSSATSTRASSEALSAAVRGWSTIPIVAVVAALFM